MIYRSEDIAIWIFSICIFAYFAYSHIWLEMSIQALKIVQLDNFGGLWTPYDYSSSRPPKGTSLRNSASVKLSTAKIRWGVWRELTESVMDSGHTHRHTQYTQVNLYFVHVGAYRRRYKSRRSSKPNCIKKNKKNKIWRKRFSIWRMELLHAAMWHVCGSGIMTVNSPSGSTLQCDT